jgi:hypothetical protein
MAVGRGFVPGEEVVVLVVVLLVVLLVVLAVVLEVGSIEVPGGRTYGLREPVWFSITLEDAGRVEGEADGD